MIKNKMIYVIDWIENKPTATGKERAVCSLTAVSGEKYTNVTIWGDFPGFKDLMPGSEVEGDVVPPKDPQYGPTLYPPRKTTYTPRANRAGEIRTAMKEKAEGIEKSQDRKEMGIYTSSTFRDATLLSIAEKGDGVMTHEEMKSLWLRWRDWLAKQYDYPEQTPF